MIEANSEVFLVSLDFSTLLNFKFKCGVIPLWESMPDGANIDINFKSGAEVVPFWQKMVIAGFIILISRFWIFLDFGFGTTLLVCKGFLSLKGTTDHIALHCGLIDIFLT